VKCFLSSPTPPQNLLKNHDSDSTDSDSAADSEKRRGGEGEKERVRGVWKVALYNSFTGGRREEGEWRVEDGGRVERKRIHSRLLALPYDHSAYWWFP